MKIAKLIQAAAVSALFAAGSAGAVNIIQNGGFEDYSVVVADNSYTMVEGGSTAIDFWTVTGTSIDLIKNSYGSVGFGTSVDMLGTPGPGGLKQEFTFSANTTYQLTFDVSRNPYGSYTALAVDVNGQHQEFTGTNPYNTYTMSFTTGNTGGTQWLQFSSLGEGNSGAVLDNVMLTAVPEPETYGMLLGGLGLIGFMARRRKAAK